MNQKKRNKKTEKKLKDLRRSFWLQCEFNREMAQRILKLEANAATSERNNNPFLGMLPTIQEMEETSRQFDRYLADRQNPLNSETIDE